MTTDAAQIDRWWRTAVVYQVYIRSFADGNGDGTGDIAGLRSKLGYLRDLGVDAIWINPWYRSPLADGGYDVADYRDIDPQYGTLDEAEALVREAHEHGIKVIGDLVPNHTSEQHVWFQEAINAPIGDPSRERYHIRPGKGPDGAEPPSDWRSVFGGPAWTRLPDGEWYLHLFAPEQPDLNWEHPEVRSEFCDVLRFWMDRDLDGFRVDVAHGLVKAPGYPDANEEQRLLAGARGTENHPFWDRDGIHPIVREWREVLDGYPGGRMLVAEAWVPRPERLALYLRPDEYHQSFNFSLLEAEWTNEAYRTIIGESLESQGAIGAAPTWVMSNHDVVRHATRLGLPEGTDWRDWLLNGDRSILDVETGLTRARAVAMLMLALPGGTYLYQGEELGLPEVHDLPVEVLDDPVWERSDHTAKGRDGCRVPMPWTIDGPAFGFGSDEPWLPMPDEFGSMSADAQAGVEGSVLELYRSALALRRDHLVADEDLEFLDAEDGVFAIRRGSGVRCVVNMGAEPVTIDGEVLLSSGPLTADGALPSDTAVWLR